MGGIIVRNIYGRVRKFLGCLAFLLVFWGCAGSLKAEEETEGWDVYTEASVIESDKIEKTKIRIGYPEQFGFTQIDDDGNYFGYTYDYFMRIAQSKGWELECVLYDFSNDGLSQSLEDLRNGEIDVIGAMVYSEALAEQYEFCTKPYGSTDFVLLSNENNMELNRRTVYDYPDLTVALVEKATGQNQLFDEFCKEQGIDYIPIYLETKEECVQLLDSGEADALISKNVVPNTGFKTVVSFGTQPFYFASSKGQSELTKAIDEEIQNITALDPDYQINLHQKHFTKDSDYLLALTAQEIAYINQGNKVKVVIVENNKPLQHYDQKTQEFSGILVDILDFITQKCGLEFQLVPAANYIEAKEMLKDGRADVIAGLPYSYSVAQKENLLLTSPVIDVPIVKVSNSGAQNDIDEYLVTSDIASFYTASNFTEMDDVEKILDLIGKEKYKSAYMNSYTAQHYVEESGFVELYLTTIPYSSFEISFGVSKDCDIRVMGILNQTISCISPREEEEIVYQNTMHIHKLGFLGLLRSNPLEIILGVLIVASFILILLTLLFIKSKKLNKLIYIEKLKFEEISQLDRLTHTYNNIAFKILVREFLDFIGKSEEKCNGALLICDIDDFKEVNDTYGHLKGDKVIESLGQIMINTFHENCIVGRIGGDEMAVLLKTVEEDLIISNKCGELLEFAKNIDKDFSITLSIGVKKFSSEISFEELFEKADSILYKVKEQGKNNFIIE